MSNLYSQQAINLAQEDYVTLVFMDDEDDEIGYVAVNPQLKGTMSQGNTPDEAITNLLDARTLYIEDLLEMKEPIPQPLRKASNLHILIDLSDFSGIVANNDDISDEIDSSPLVMT